MLMATPRVMPEGFSRVEKIEGSGSPAGVFLPVSRLSPLRWSMVTSPNSDSSRWRMTTAEGSPSHEELVTRQMMPLPVCSAMRRSATRKNRM